MFSSQSLCLCISICFCLCPCLSLCLITFSWQRGDVLSLQSWFLCLYLCLFVFVFVSAFVLAFAFTFAFDFVLIPFHGSQGISFHCSLGFFVFIFVVSSLSLSLSWSLSLFCLNTFSWQLGDIFSLQSWCRDCSPDQTPSSSPAQLPPR